MTASTTTTDQPQRIRSEVVSELIAYLDARANADNAQARKTTSRIISQLEEELRTAPIQRASGSQVVDVMSVLSHLQTHAGQAFSAQDLAAIVGEVTPATKARVVHFLRRVDETPEGKVTEAGSPGRYVYRFDPAVAEKPKPKRTRKPKVTPEAEKVNGEHQSKRQERAEQRAAADA